MASSPVVSIVVPLFNDAEFVVSALESCLAQSLTDIEIICIDDASTDETVNIVEDYQRRHPRIRLIRQPANLSAFQARRAGIEAATAPYILFLDGDDELLPHAAETALRLALSAKADVVGFGVDIITASSEAPRRFEAALQPKYSELISPNILPSLLPVGEAANGHLWRYLFSTPLLRKAYDGFDAHITFYRANDLPITFLALAHATKYVSTTERLYRYYFRRGTSGHTIDSLERFQFLLSGIDPITAISDEVLRVAEQSTAPESVLRCYDSARLHMIGAVLTSCVRETSGAFQQSCLKLIEECVGKVDLVRAAAGFCTEALLPLSLTTVVPLTRDAPKRSVLLHTAHLDTGGLQSVLLEQAEALTAAGFEVTIAVLRDTTRKIEIPPGVTVELVTGDQLARVDRWLEICEAHSIDIIIDHHILYNEHWTWFALAALAVGVPTVGWVHNFALRPLFDASLRTTFLSTHMRLLWRVVTLSPADVAFWKLRGVEHVVYLPNPLSPLALTALENGIARNHPGGRLELVWWGRLDGPTKQVLHLIDTARELRTRGVDFRMRIIGPDSKNLTAEKVRTEIRANDVGEVVELMGERTPAELAATLADAHLLVSTSAIEGAPLTLLEAQALGLPVVMYDLPWLTVTRQNDGMVRTTPGDPAGLADAIASIAGDPDRYEALSRSAREFAHSASSVDVQALTVALILDDLPAEFSPEPRMEDAQLLVQWLVSFAERNLRISARERASQARDAQLKLRRMQRRLKEISEGPSFRVGRLLTYLPRKVRELVRPASNKNSNGRGSHL